MNLRTESLALAAYAALGAVTAVAWARLPQRVPVHWGLTGPPDAYGSPYGLLLLLPVVAVLTYGLLCLVPAADPTHTRTPEFQMHFPRIRAWMVVLFVCIQVVMALSMGGAVTDPLAASAVVIGLWLAGFGPMLSHVPRNIVVGIRTPMTLKSDAAWSAAHRLGARIFIAGGVALAIAGLTRSRIAMLVALVAFIVGALYAGTRGAMVQSDGDRPAGAS